MRRPLMLLAALVIPVLPVLAAAPAYAVDNVICVNTADSSCTPGQGAASITAAIDLAEDNLVADTILVGPGAYQDGPWELNAVEPITLKGSGEGSTILTLPPAGQQTYLRLDGAHAQDLTVQLAATSSDGDRGIAIYNGGSARSVTVHGEGTTNTTAVTLNDASLADATLLLDPEANPSTTGIFSDGGSIVTDAVVTGGRGYVMSSIGSSDLLARLHMTAADEAITVDGGTVNVDDTLIDLGDSNGTGLSAANHNPGTADKTINADHVTIVGGGTGSTGALAYAGVQAAKQLSAVKLTNSIISGPHRSLVVQASNDGLQGGDSSAFINASFSDWDPDDTVETIGANGLGDVVSVAGNVDVTPGFVDVAGGNFRLAASSPLVDAGDPAAGGPAFDLDALTRVFDGNGDGTARRDMGAYEYRLPAPPTPPADTTAPETSIAKKPAKRVTARKVTFRFASSEAGATFQCQRDAMAWKPCTSPYRFKIKLGKHVFRVRAVDAAGNVDATPARYRFKRIPKP